MFLRQAGGGFAQESGSPYQFPIQRNMFRLDTADFNADSRIDIAAANESGGSASVLLRQAGGGFAEESGSPTPAGQAPGPSWLRTSTAMGDRTWRCPTRTDSAR